MKNIDHLFHIASKIIESDRVHLFLLIDDNEYLCLETATELITCKEKQVRNLSIYREIKKIFKQFMVKPRTSDIRMTYKYIRVTYG